MRFSSMEDAYSYLITEAQIADTFAKPGTIFIVHVTYDEREKAYDYSINRINTDSLRTKLKPFIGEIRRTNYGNTKAINYVVADPPIAEQLRILYKEFKQITI